MKFIKALISIGLFFITVSAQAALVTVNNFDLINYNPADEYQFTGELSNSNQLLTYGFTVNPGQSFNFTVNAPTGVDIMSIMSTQSAGNGFGLASPNGTSIITGGTSFTYPVSGDVNIGGENWITLAIGPAAIAYINANYGGSIQVGDLLTGTDQLYDPTQGNGDGGGPVGAVPIPAALPLMASALGLFGISRGRYSIKPKV